MISNLLAKVDPPQEYSHVGIMTRNYYEVTHSTSSTERYKGHRAGWKGSDGFQEDVIRYGWPGVITQTVYHAFNGEAFVDPKGGKEYDVDGFAATPQKCGGDKLVYPRVIKPPPGSPTVTRERLKAAADTALHIATNEKSHYRFFAYSDADIVTKNKAPSEFPDGSTAKDWAENSLATVCSSFIWHCLKRNDIQLEGELEAADVKNGAQLNKTIDGLYFYTAEERLDAAEWLFDYIHNVVHEQAGWLGELLTDAADDTANQLVNCFISVKSIRVMRKLGGTRT